MQLGRWLKPQYGGYNVKLQCRAERCLTRVRKTNEGKVDKMCYSKALDSRGGSSSIEGVWATARSKNDSSPRGTPNRGKGGKSINLIKFDHFFFYFLRKWSWGPLDRLKILSWSPLRCSTIGKPILRTCIFSSIFDQNRPLAHFSLSQPWPSHAW